MKNFSSLFSTVVFASLAVVATSCKDDDDQKSRTDLLTGTSWMIDKSQVELAGQSIDVPSDFSECGADDVYTFTKAGVFTSAPGVLACDDDSDSYSGTWAWKDGETILTVTVSDDDPKSDDADDSAVIVLTETQLKIQNGTMEWDTNFDGKIDSNDTPLKLYTIYKSK